MAELVRHNNPAFQIRTGADTDKDLDIEVRHPYVPWRFTGMVYRRDFDGGAGTLVRVFQTFRGDSDSEVELFSVTLGASDFKATFDQKVELGHEQGIRVTATGELPGGGESHRVVINWEERLDQGR